MLEKLTKMVPKPLQNRSWRGSGGHLGATLEIRCFQDFIFDDFGSILGPHLGASLGSFWALVLMFFDTASGWRFHRFGVHLGPLLVPFFGPSWKLFGQLYIIREMYENTNIYYGLSMSEL